MTRLEPDFALHIMAALFVSLAIPFYLGLVHWSGGRYFVYCGVAGLCLATGDYLTTDGTLRAGPAELFCDAVIRSLGILLLGGTIYLFAWLF